MRKKISAELKAKAAIEAVKGIKTISEISSLYEVHPNQVSLWKKQFLESAADTFSKPIVSEDKQREQETDHLYRKIGQLEIENDFLKKKVASNSGQVGHRRTLVERDHPRLSLVQQCILLGLSRSGLYYESKRSLKDDELMIKEAIDRQYLVAPYYGIRRMKEYLTKLGFVISRKRVSRYYKDMRITAIYPKPKITWHNQEHKLYPYLLRNLEIAHCNQVWSTDITYIPMNNGFMYLCAIIDWHSRYVLAWGISNTHDSEFCQELLKEAIAKHGCPDIFNTDQGSEFTATAFTNILKDNQINISMDGKGRALDNIFIERLWRSVKYEYIYISRPENGRDLQNGLEDYFKHYNELRLHQSLDYKTPEEVYLAA